jgi:hypothetical protein
MSLWVTIVVAFVGVFAASLTFEVALGRSARRADEAVESSPELAEIAASLRPLSSERSPSGRRFFPTPEARSQLAALVYDLLKTTTAA